MSLNLAAMQDPCFPNFPHTQPVDPPLEYSCPYGQW